MLVLTTSLVQQIYHPTSLFDILPSIQTASVSCASSLLKLRSPQLKLFPSRTLSMIVHGYHLLVGLPGIPSSWNALIFIMSQGTRPSKKETTIKDTKQYLKLSYPVQWWLDGLCQQLCLQPCMGAYCSPTGSSAWSSNCSLCAFWPPITEPTVQFSTSISMP